MVDKISSPTPEDQAATPPQADPASVTEGTANQGQIEAEQEVDPSGDAGTQQEPTEESFTDVDPSTLSAEGQEKHRNMLTDYKRKTAALAEERRAYEQRIKDLEQKAQIVDQLQQDEDLLNYINKRNSQGPSQNNQGQPESLDGITEDEFNEAFTSKDKFANVVKRLVEGERRKLKSELEETKGSLRVEKADRFVKEFKNRPEYSDFDQLDKYKFITYQVAMNRPSPNATEREWEDLLKKAYNNAKAVRDDIYTRGYQAGLKRISEKSNNYSEPPTGGTPPVYQSGDPKNISASEAFEMAKRGIRVPQDW